MSETPSSTISEDYYYRSAAEIPINELFESTVLTDATNYNRLYDCLQRWLKETNFTNMKERNIQFDFYQNCMKAYNSDIGHMLKYTSDYHGTVFKKLFRELIPDFCIIDYYNSHLKSSSSHLDLEYLPLHIVSILKIKRNMKEKDIGQLLRYLRVVLGYSPKSRTYIMGAITDFQTIRYGKVSRLKNGRGFMYQASLVLPGQNEAEFLLKYLTKFLTMNFSQFGHNRLEPLPSYIRIHDKLLGIGANAMTFNCSIVNGDRCEYALKISNASVDKEEAIYKKLYKSEFDIVKVHEYALLFRHPPGSIISKVNLFENIRTLWKQIKEAHRNNILHRDIRKANVLEIWNNETNR